MLIIRKVAIFGIPLFLVLLEAVLRDALGVDARAFLGPTLAGVGIGFTIPLMGIKAVTELPEKGLVVYARRDLCFFLIVVIMLILMVSGWYISLYYSLKSQSEELRNVPILFGLGVAICVVGIGLSMIKDHMIKDKL